MTVARFGRRNFLRGVGGGLLALPMLESLLPREVLAQAFVPRPRFVAIATEHGGVAQENMYPPDSVLTERRTLYSDHTIRRGQLSLDTAPDGRARLSPVLTASADRFTPQIVSKMNVVRGLDIPWFIGHHTGGHLGNYAATTTGSVPPEMTPRPTIDQFLAYSPKFYTAADLSHTKLRSVNIGLDMGGLSMSFGYTDPARRSGEIVAIPSAKNSADLFASLFMQPSTTNTKRKSVVSQVFESYKQLRNGAFGAARRLSSADARRLDEHMSRLAELEQRAGIAVSCTATPPSKRADPNHPGASDDTNVAATAEYFSIFNEVLAIAFACGTCRVATIHVGAHFHPFPGDWHQQVAHLFAEAPQQAILAEGHRGTFESVFLDLAARLDVEEANGSTYLDNTLIMWSQESGPVTHDSYGIPVITAGGACGAISTGQYVDYRRTSTDIIYSLKSEYPGVYYNRWLSTALTAMGLSSSDYGEQGYASNYRPDAVERWPQRLADDAGKPLPFLMG